MLHATIMAGGAGTRFWPASRRSNPKQLLNLHGERSMLQATVDRLQGLVPADHLLVVTNQQLVEATRQQLPQLPAGSVVGEPAKRDTAPCIGLAAALTLARDPDATMVVMPADHVIGPPEVFQQALQQAAQLVDESPDRIVTFGIRPTYPAEVFGYIERGTPIEGPGMPTFEVQKFREKPDRESAESFLALGTFYWNAGIFAWKAKTILAALETYAPEMHRRIRVIADRLGQSDYSEILEREFSAIEGTSIDYAVMERYAPVLVVEAAFEWDDLGNWTALPRLLGVDESGNCLTGRQLSIDTQRSIVKTDEEHLVVTVGMEDCIVIHTPDATLVANRKDEAAIKRVVQQLQERGWDQYL